MRMRFLPPGGPVAAVPAILLSVFLILGPACKPRDDSRSEPKRERATKAEKREAPPSERRGNGPLQIVEVPPFVTLAKELNPVVVNISTSRSFEGSQMQQFHTPFSGPEGENPFGEFFERFFENLPQGMRKQTSLGSGFIIDKSGLVVTNNHVIEKADDIKVTTSDGSVYPAKVKGMDPKTDVALIQIEPKGDLPEATLGNSDELEIGEWVMAIGNPFGLGHTVTAGIVSAKGRVLNSGPYDDFIQTDASINPGNSGGPLFNIRGEVVGINTAIVAQGQGIGFATPVNMARKVLAQLKKSGKVVRGWMGVSIQRIDPAIAESLGLEDAKGALVADVMKGGPADKAGIKRRDVIIEFKGEEVGDFHNLPAMVAEVDPGTEVEIKLLRDGKEKSVSVMVDEMKDERQAKADPSPKVDAVGLKVKELDESQAERLGLEKQTAVGVAEVKPGTAADEAGI
ncbi:MAG: Do family serine endopeptidase, partial [Deltaproteobacteria bacterium]|nr:Do family serine endopeptidase [Deltaproteobacteria bacterium]